MNEANGDNDLLNERVQNDCASAREEYDSFELAFRVLQPAGLAYLRRQSAAYKRAVLALQETIMPAIRRHCPNCEHGTCCRLHSPKLNIYIARSVGGFNLVDYLLVRCGKKMPLPNIQNTRKNLCAFWENGCSLRPDSRSLLCLQYFCASLRRSLDMELVNQRLTDVQSVVNNFSLNELFK